MTCRAPLPVTSCLPCAVRHDGDIKGCKLGRLLRGLWRRLHRKVGLSTLKFVRATRTFLEIDMRHDAYRHEKKYHRRDLLNLTCNIGTFLNEQEDYKDSDKGQEDLLDSTLPSGTPLKGPKVSPFSWKCGALLDSAPVHQSSPTEQHVKDWCKTVD